MLLLSACGPKVGGEGEFLNLAPEVEYTGIESCQSCHQGIYDSYLETGMGKSFYRPDEATAVETFGPEVVIFDPPSNLNYHPFWKNGAFFIQEFRLDSLSGDTIHNRVEKVDYIVGSGHQTRSYIMDRNGYFYEAPITWYVSKQKWDLSPGYENGQNSRFDREIGEECMACHTGHLDFVEGTSNRFHEVSLGIDCEKCHGPGSLHIERMEQDLMVDVGDGEIDYSIVNPKHLSVEEEFSICQQCHLQGFNVMTGGESVLDYRPGMELSRVYEIFIVEEGRGENSFGIASHGERLMESKCFISSEDMRCTTCHDPHKSIGATDTLVYVKQCQSCHTGTVECAAPESVQMEMEGNCVSCHMPKGGTSDIPHVQFTDHKIRVVQPDTVNGEAIATYLDLVCKTSENPSSENTGKAWLLYYERNEANPKYLAKAKKLLGNQSDSYTLATIAYYEQDYAGALPLIEQALVREPKNTWFLFRKAQILEAQGKLPEALALYQEIWNLNRNIAKAGLRAGILTMSTAQPESRDQALRNARSIFKELDELQPKNAQVKTNLGFVEMNAGNFDLARDYFKSAIALDPDYQLPRENLALLESISR